MSFPKFAKKYYLNHNFYQTLDKNYLVAGKFYIGSYNDNYTTVYQENTEAYVGLMSVLDNYINDFSGYYLLTPATSDMVYSVGENGRLSITSIEESLKIRPVIYLTKNINLIGSGTNSDPFIIE